MTRLELEARVLELARELDCSVEHAVALVVFAERARQRRERRSDAVGRQRPQVDPTTKAGRWSMQNAARGHRRHCRGRCGGRCWLD